MTGKKIVSFSLYGKHPYYTWGAIDNARHARWFYPGWICRFYVADDVPQGIVSRIKNYGAEVINMGPYIGHEARLWRFLATVDPEVDISICRDTDTRFSKIELMMVNEWLASGKKFHVLHQINKERPIFAGMWGVRGTIPEFKEPLENFLRSPSQEFFQETQDEKFLQDILYPMTKGNVHVHKVKGYPGLKQIDWFTDEQVQLFTAWRGIRVGSPRRIFVALSIYKNIPFYEYFLAKFIGIIEDRNPFRLYLSRIDRFLNLNVRFYVADDIRPDLVERLRKLGQVIMKPARAVHKDDPKYWKLSILAEKDLGMVMITGFWDLFFLVRAARQELRMRNTLLDYKPTGIKGQFRNVTPLSVCGPDIPLAQIEDLVAQRDPDESYQKFVRSTLEPRIAPVISNFVLYPVPIDVGFYKGWSSLLLPMLLDYNKVDRIKRILKKLLRR